MVQHLEIKKWKLNDMLPTPTIVRKINNANKNKVMYMIN